MQSITDGTSNTGLFSERLLSNYALRVDRDGLSVGHQPAYRAVFTLVRSGTSQLGDGSPTCLERQSGTLVRCRDVTRSRTRRHRLIRATSSVSRSWRANPGYPVLTSYMHWTPPKLECPARTRPDSWSRPIWMASALMARPRRAALHSGGVNLPSADGSVHFIKSSISPASAGGASAPGPAVNVISSDQY